MGLIALLTVVVIVAVVGVLALRPEKTLIQGEAEAAEYRVSGKVPGRIEMYLYEEGEQVKKGDTLEILYVSSDPTQISEKNITGNAVIFIAAGAVLVLIGAVTEIKALKGR